nr:kappa-casein [Loxodonta africana]
MKGFLLVVNILLLPLPFLAAEVQNQEESRLFQCLEKDERWFCQKAVKYIPNDYVLKSYYRYEPNYNQFRAAVPINNPYLIYLYPAKQVAVRPHTQIPQWQVPSNIYPSPSVPHTYLKPPFIVIPPKKTQDKPIIPPTGTVASIEATVEPKVNTVVNAEASSEFIATNTPEATTVPVISPQI